MNDQITVYEKPTCTKCRQLDRFLRESGVDFSKVNYYLAPLNQKKLKELIGKMKITPRDLRLSAEAFEKAERFNVEAGLLKPDEALKSYDGFFTDQFVK